MSSGNAAGGQILQNLFALLKQYGPMLITILVSLGIIKLPTNVVVPASLNGLSAEEEDKLNVEVHVCPKALAAHQESLSKLVA